MNMTPKNPIEKPETAENRLGESDQDGTDDRTRINSTSPTAA
jgi:hypothetical protein